MLFRVLVCLSRFLFVDCWELTNRFSVYASMLLWFTFSFLLSYNLIVKIEIESGVTFEGSRFASIHLLMSKWTFLAPTGALEEVIWDLCVSVCVLYAIKLWKSFQMVTPASQTSRDIKRSPKRYFRREFTGDSLRESAGKSSIMRLSKSLSNSSCKRSMESSRESSWERSCESSR